jgi:hypothetical protein
VAKVERQAYAIKTNNPLHSKIDSFLKKMEKPLDTLGQIAL